MLFDSFKTRAEAVSAEVVRCTTVALAVEWLLGFLRKEGVAVAPGQEALWLEPKGAADGRWQQLRSLAGVSCDITLESAARARFGISHMEWALADTGSLAQDATAIEQRLVSSLPAIHIALLPVKGILPDMATLLTTVSPRECAYLAMITGPSRTADIERVLTIGVHGPERLVIVCIDDMGGDN